MVLNWRFSPSLHNSYTGEWKQVATDGQWTQRVGVWDLEVNAGFLPEILEELNTVQNLFVFETIDAAVPRAISIGGESTLAWAKKQIGKKKALKNAEFLRQNIVANRLQEIGSEAKREFGFDLIVVLTPDKLAFSDQGRTHWNYYSWSYQNVIIVSAADVRQFAQKAKRPFEVAISAMMIAQMLQELFQPEVGFHRENRGCIFDHNKTRTTLVDTFHHMRIEASCLMCIPEPYRTAADSVIRKLRSSKSR